RHSGRPRVNTSAQPIQDNWKKRQYNGLRGDDFDIILTEENMQKCQKSHIEWARGNTTKIIRTYQKRLGEVVIEPCIGIRERCCIRRRDRRIKTILQGTYRDSQPQYGGHKPDQDGYKNVENSSGVRLGECRFISQKACTHKNCKRKQPARNRNPGISP